MNMRLSILLVLAGSVCAWATDYTWTQPLDGTNWNDSTSWTPAGYPNSAEDVAVFTNIGLSNATFKIYLSNSCTVGVIRCDAGLQRHLLQTRGGIKRLVLQRTGGNAQIITERPDDGATPVFQFFGGANQLAVEVPDGLDVIVNNNIADNGVAFDCPLVGGGAVNKYGSNTLYLSVASPLYTGVLHVYDGYVRETGQDALSNATAVVHSTGRFDTRGLTSFETIVLDGGTHENGYRTNYHFGRVLVVNDSFSRVFTGTRIEYWGDVAGTATLTKLDYNGRVAFSGSISPGIGGPGVLTINESQGIIEVGAADMPVTLNVEVNGAGGVPGVDHDQLIFQALETDLNLTNINVVVKGSGVNPDATNWFLAANKIDFTTWFYTASNASGASQIEFVTDTTAKQIGVVLVPEPTVMAVCAALVWLWRRSCV